MNTARPTYASDGGVAAAVPLLSSPPVRNVSLQRQLGAYYTCPDAALVMARWVLGDGARRILEPSFGAGVFLSAVRAEAAAAGRSLDITGAELAEDAFQEAVDRGLVEQRRAHRGDFLAWTPPAVDAVIGNPPYVRLRHLPASQAAAALHVASQELGASMETSGSVWMPFVLHAARCLRPGGRMALVLPFEFTYVRYARPLWRRLGQIFGALRLVRVHERLFPDILQDVVILFADRYGGSCETVEFQAFDKVAEFLDGSAGRAAQVSVAEVAGGERAFMRALLPDALIEELSGRLRRCSVPVRDVCTFNIGYVSGHKGFFHPDAATRATYNLPPSALVPAYSSGRQLKSIGLRTSGSDPSGVDQLFLPRGGLVLTDGERRYIKYGEELGVHQRYKCKVREPWYVVPGVRTPDLILSVFSERPILSINDGNYAATNSLLCGFMKRGSAESFAAAWYSSLTLLGCESEVHSLGGGVMVLVPKETGSIRLPVVSSVPAGFLDALGRLLSVGDVQGAYDLGDEAILRGELRLPAKTVDLIRVGVNTLAHWRTSARGGISGLDDSDDE